MAALKNPDEAYRHRVFRKAEACLDAADFDFELGWVMVRPDCRGNRLTERMLRVLLKEVGARNVYATSRIDNDPMRRTLFRFGFQSEGTHYRSDSGNSNLMLHVRLPALENRTGSLRANGQFHGSPKRFDSFEVSELWSFGFHFGDIHQAKHFAKESGFIYKADLKFQRCLDIDSDWGWTCAKFVALALHGRCALEGIPHNIEDFVAILGPAPWSSANIEKTDRITMAEQAELIALLAKCGFDGVRYINRFEPPGSVNRIAYFVIDPSQIQLRGVSPTGEVRI